MPERIAANMLPVESGLKTMPSDMPKEKRIPFTVTIQPAIPFQKKVERLLSVPVVVEGGVEILTPEAHRMIDDAKTQGSISMLYEAFRRAPWRG